MSSANTPDLSSPLGRHEFLIRRLHSLTGLIPVGAYMCIHLLVNASILNGPGTFQRAVYQIHSLGGILPLVEWVFIFLPILFHGVLGVIIYFGAVQNTRSYPYGNNVRYALQRVTGLVAFLFIVWHVHHTRGWFHFGGLAEYLHGATFRPYNAASSLGQSMGGVLTSSAYAIGVLCCVFHLANGIWTMGITWGVWITPAAQRRASWVCLALGLTLAGVGMGALVGSTTVDVGDALRIEDAMFQAKTDSGEVELQEAQPKRWTPQRREELDEVSAASQREMVNVSRRD